MNGRLASTMFPTVVLCGGQRTLQALLQGLAPTLGMSFHMASELREIPEFLSRYGFRIVVIAIERLEEEHLLFIQSLTKKHKAYIILIGQDWSERTAHQAIQSGAVAYLGGDSLTDSLAALVETLKRNLPETPPLRKVLDAGNNATLSTPDYVLSDGERKISLPTIPGKLLEYLIEHADGVTTFHELNRAGWGIPEAAAPNALYQQIHVLKEALAEYGLRNCLRSVRGRGYVYSPKVLVSDRPADLVGGSTG